jgi:hypothetical protein
MTNVLIDSDLADLSKREFIRRFKLAQFMICVNFNFMYFHLVYVKKYKIPFFDFANFSEILFLVILIIQAMFNFG